MATSDIVLDYYDKLAKNYDKDRFGNTYGQYIHRQEAKLLTVLLKDISGVIVDLGCGTGRLTSFATIGLDGSNEMLTIAKEKYPGKKFICSSITQLPFEDNSIDAIYSFHVFMHLPKQTADAAFIEMARSLKPGGKLLFDFPSIKRRRLFLSGNTGWHGNTAYEIKRIKKELGKGFDFNGHYGILFLPIHRLPKSVRKYFSGLDNFLCRSFFKTYASYNLASFTKK